MIQKVFLLVLMMMLGGCSNPAIGKSSSTFGIYLTESEVDPRLLAYGKGDWSEVKISAKPLVSAEDIVKYDFSKHEFTLTQDAYKRIPRPPVAGTPFVVMVGSEKIYVGVFMSAISSMSRAVPSITVDYAEVFEGTAGTLTIRRGYPNDKFGVGPDLRGDERIRKSLNGKD